MFVRGKSVLIRQINKKKDYTSPSFSIKYKICPFTSVSFIHGRPHGSTLS